MPSESVTQEEVWQLADRLSAATPSPASTTVEELAQAFGMGPQDVRRELDRLRAENSKLDELAQLRAENERLRQQIQRRPVETSALGPNWVDEKHHSTRFENGYVESISFERSRQPMWSLGVGLVIFIVFAIIMFSIFNAGKSEIDRSFNGMPQMGVQGGEDMSPAMRELIERKLREGR